MNNDSLDYSSIHVDERLLAFLPFYRAMFARKNPSLAGQMSARGAREALLRALETGGHAKRTKGPNGEARLEPTAEYLKYLSRSD
jgi:hypothetical protein